MPMPIIKFTATPAMMKTMMKRMTAIPNAMAPMSPYWTTTSSQIIVSAIISAMLAIRAMSSVMESMAPSPIASGIATSASTRSADVCPMRL